MSLLRRRADKELRRPFFADAAIADTLLRGLRRSGIPINSLEDIETYLDDLGDTGRQDLLAGLQAHVEERRAGRRAQLRAEGSIVDHRRMTWVVQPGGAITEQCEDDAARVAEQQRSLNARRQAEVDDRATEAEAREQHRQALAEELVRLSPPGSFH